MYSSIIQLYSSRSFSFSKYWLSVFSVLCMLTLSSHSIFAHDLALRVSLSKSLGRVGDTIICEIKLVNEGATNIGKTDVFVLHSGALQIVDIKSTLGSYDKYANKWIVLGLKADQQSSDLTIRYLITQSGPSAVTSEIIWSSEKDADSKPANSDIHEDDISYGTITVPIVICGNIPIDITANALPNYEKYQWKRNEVIIQGENTVALRITEPGNYSYLVLENEQMSATSGPIIVERGDYPLVDLGDPITITAGQEIFVKPEVSGGLAPYRYKWSNDIKWDMKRKLKKGQVMNLKVRVTDRRGCITHDAVQVTVK
jgi:Domain of unknown function DUF11